MPRLLSCILENKYYGPSLRTVRQVYPKLPFTNPSAPSKSYLFLMTLSLLLIKEGGPASYYKHKPPQLQPKRSLSSLSWLHLMACSKQTKFSVFTVKMKTDMY